MELAIYQGHVIRRKRKISVNGKYGQSRGMFLPCADGVEYRRWPHNAGCSSRAQETSCDCSISAAMRQYSQGQTFESSAAQHLCFSHLSCCFARCTASSAGNVGDLWK